MICLPVAQGSVEDSSTATEVSSENTDALNTLGSFIELRKSLSKEINDISQKIKTAETESEKNDLKEKLVELESELDSATRNLEIIAAGTDISALGETATEDFNFTKELFSLLKPALDEMKEMTSHVRQKSELRDKITRLEERLIVINAAIANIQTLTKASNDENVKQALTSNEERWRKHQSLTQGELQAARLQLEKLATSEISLSEASQNYLKSFFQKRGRYLGEALLVVLAVLIISRLSQRAMVLYIPGFRKKHRSFRLRVIELLHRIITIILVILGPMLVFYIVEDWVLFSLGILLLIGVSLTLRKTLPSYWQQIQLFLNIGSVREGERLLLDGLPWRVDQINIFCMLANPTADLQQRVPISKLVSQKSRPARKDEPWFPSRKGDWVLLNDGVRGKVTGVSPEMVQLIERGGAQITYRTSDFLAATPRNLGTNFRIKETIGISYELQKEATTTIPDILTEYIQTRILKEGYGDQLLNLRVEFERANTSSLDIVVIADFIGELGDLYNRLRRAIQRWCVDACSENDWQIPFQQIVIHAANEQK